MKMGRVDHTKGWLCVFGLLLINAQLCLGDLEATFARCCTLGGNWASEGLKCVQFPAPVAGVPAEEQSICLSAVEVCCIRSHREQMCESGKRAAQEEKDCVVDKRLGGEHQKDCCEACKLGMISGSMGNACSFSKFSFGFPWDSAYQSCCSKSSPAPSAPVTIPSSWSSPTQKQSGSTTNFPTPALDSLCDLLPGELCDHICIPIPGSYRCSCRTGFSLLPDGKSCSQEDLLDRCTANNPCSQKCFDTGVAIECSCHPGYQLQPDEVSCKDIDECQLEIDSCDHTTQICLNQPGSYVCENSDGSHSKPIQKKDNNADHKSEKCPIGYQFNFQSQVCDDVDECRLSKGHCSPSQTCQNTIGSYLCGRRESFDDCDPGFRYNSVQKTCRDINECAEATDNCDRDKQNCLNVDGGFTCQDRAAKSQCPAGYKFNKALSKCEDVDECSENLHSCVLSSENCRNIDGAYECDIKCGAGLRFDVANRSCHDIDECEMKTSKCTTSEICVNTVGSHYCQRKSTQTCPAGYKPDPENQTGCQDVDECREDINPCDRGTEICVNEVGSYHCTPVTSSTQSLIGVSSVKLEQEVKTNCLSGYTYNFDRKLCLDRDECLDGTATCSSNERCLNSIGSYECIPKCHRGFQVNPNNARECVDTDECALGIDNCNRRYETCSNTAGAFQCLPRNNQQPIRRQPSRNQCPAGFKVDENLTGCIDVDECSDGGSPCNRDQDCINNRGSFSCVQKQSHLNSSSTGSDNCPAGFIYNPLLLRCFDINECVEQIHVCNQETESCINEPGGYRCGPKLPEKVTRPTLDRNSCEPGYRMHPGYRSCVDVNECTESTEPPCDSNQQCVNTPGSFLCSCRIGFHLDPITKACVDVNECQINQHNCLNSQRCDNTIGSFQCIRFTSCGTGYTLNSQSGLCEDDDECALQIDDCHIHGPTWLCRNTAGSFRCEKKRCEPTYKLNNAGVCIGPDGRPHGAEAPVGATLGTTLGTTQASIECPIGFRSDQRGCTDVNECEARNVCRRNQRCVNTRGSFICMNLLNCNRGFEMNDDATTCTDIDECATNTHECGKGQTCVNHPGGYTCQCPAGHTFSSDKECVDVDECTKFAGQVCAVNSDCENTIGSYRCNCKTGFKHTKDNKSCQDVDECLETPGLCQHSCVNVWGSYRCTCRSGFTMNNDNRSCADVDECELFRDKHICVGPCVNQPGSYSCRCPEGYNLGADGRTCQDIDECQGGSTCPNPNEICLNTRGSYRCNTISCPPNFIRDTEHKNRCTRASLYCREGDQACLRLPLSYTFNFITFVSNLAIGPLGHLDLFTMRVPLWKSSTARFNLEMLNTRAPNGIRKVTKNFFRLRNTGFNQAVISLVESIPGPQEIELQLSMDLNHNGEHGGSFTEHSIMCRRMCIPSDSICHKNKTKSITYDFISIPSMTVLANRVVLARIQAVTQNKGAPLKAGFRVLRGNDEAYFDFEIVHGMGELILVRSLQGPKQFELLIQLAIPTQRRHSVLTKHLAAISISVAAHNF